MNRNIFVTFSPVPPERWRLAFPDAEIARGLPEGLPEGLEAGTLVWLHNLLPGELASAERPPGVRYIVMHDEPTDAGGLAALSQGAAGYCNAQVAPELLHTIAAVVRSQGLWVGESLLGRLIAGLNTRLPSAARQHEHPALASLTERERAVALCVARGDPNKQIARELNLAERTIKAHLTRAFDKLGVRDRLQLALLLSAAD